jgi:hypothetical protein
MLLFLMHEAIAENSCRFFMGTSVLLEVITTNQKYWLVLIMNSASVVLVYYYSFPSVDNMEGS